MSDGDLGNDADWSKHFLPLWDQIHDLMLVSEPKSIDGLTDTLISQGFLTLNKEYTALLSARNLVFAIVGWQTMLYKPDCIQDAFGSYRVSDEMHGHCGETRICLEQPSVVGSSNLPNFLLGFGLMLPPRNHCSLDDQEGRRLFSQTKVVHSTDLEARILIQVCGIKFQWVDSLSCHLEMDQPSGILYVFRFPSFCLWNLEQQQLTAGQTTPIYRCALESPDSVQWAGTDDITGLLHEILLSYRLIFGHEKRSRAAFRKLQPFKGMPQEEHDALLAQLCGRKQIDCSMALVERDEYDLAADFPHLRSKIVRLHSYAMSKRPRSIWQLWQDQRDSTAWLALWSVLIFGSLSLLLALLQTVFQVLQWIEGRGAH